MTETADDKDWVGAIARSRQRLVPGMDQLHATVRRLLPEPQPDQTYRVLDIGTASGLLPETILEKDPEIQVHLVHAVATNLEAARLRLARFGTQATFEQGEYQRMAFDGPFDVVILELTASQLENKSKRTVLSAAFAALRRGGRVIGVVQVRGPSKDLENRYHAVWEAMVRANGATEGDRTATSISSAKANTATLEQQLDWMTADGFENVDCFVKIWRFAVVAGDKL